MAVGGAVGGLGERWTLPPTGCVPRDFFEGGVHSLSEGFFDFLGPFFVFLFATEVFGSDLSRVFSFLLGVLVFWFFPFFFF